jgi:FKBP-type peptidyl-prolyl cis-trans isomerase FklB
MNALKTIVSLTIAASLGAGVVLMLDRDEAAVPLDASAAEAVATLESQARQGAYKDDFAALNARRESVITLPSGVQYEVLAAGNGATPQPDDTVMLYYTGSLSDGRVFDSTQDADRPLSIELASIAVPGLREALLLMPEGSHWRVVVPPSEGFARSGNNRLRRRDLIYDIELVSIGS